jgi:hypothetical protein
MPIAFFQERSSFGLRRPPKESTKVSAENRPLVVPVRSASCAGAPVRRLPWRGRVLAPAIARVAGIRGS